MNYVIIVAGGKGLRMGTEVPKQFLPVKGKPVLMYTLERFHTCGIPMRIILVLPKEQQGYWSRLCEEHDFNVPHQIADGGETRFASSKNGLDMIPDGEQGVVGIHDGVRPFVSAEVIHRCYDTARQTGAALPVLPVTDTLRKVDGNGKGGHNVLRSNYRIVQTPQVFDIQMVKRAFEQPYSEAFTDDASVVESIGQEVTMVDGNRENIKLTTPFDLTVAEQFVIISE